MTTVDESLAVADSAPAADLSGGSLVLPAALERRLREFRGRVWRIKLVEALCAAAAGVLVGFLLLFVIDRLTEPPAWVRPLVFAAAAIACAAVPLAFQRWIWRQRSLDQVARLIARRFPSLGDELLGIIEIARDAAAGRSLGTSRPLCAAAIGQVAARSETIDFAAALPPARTRLWALLAALPFLAALGLAIALPAATANTWARFLQPWRAIDRFTFTRIEPLPARIVVPLGEPATLDVSLAAETQRRPRAAKVTVGKQRPLVAAPDAPVEEYSFALPPQLEAAPLALAVGDVRARTWLEPLLRPEIASVAAEIRLPEYLGRPDLVRQDVRGGTITTVVGSDVTLAATATRDLAAARVNGAAVAREGAVIRTPVIHVAESAAVAIDWVDAHGLAGLRPLEVAVVAKPDAPPTVALVDAPPNRSLLLDSDTLRFQVAVRDDFGIRRVGMQWEGVAADGATSATTGDRLLAQGGSEQEALDVAATFCPQALGIAPQPIVLRAFAEDFLPGRGRVFSPPLYLYIVDKGEHALVMNERLNRWRQKAGEVRDREMELLATNRELRRLPEEKLLEDETRRSVAAQAAAEDANARRLDRLVEEGAGLVREALKNPEFEAATLDQLASDIQTLADIADNRMPSVADLLREAARARLAMSGKSAEGQPSAGQANAGDQPPAGDGQSSDGKPDAGTTDNEKPPTNQLAGGESTAGQTAESRPGEGKESSAGAGEQPPKVGQERGGQPSGQSQEPGEAKPPVPQVVDRESSQQPPGAESEQDGTKKPGSGQGRFGLPTTQAGVSPPKPPRGDEPMNGERAADEALDEAIATQEALLAEFAKIADDLAAVMARLEGSTFVKRFKLASREQATLGGRIAGFSAEAFGQPDERPLAVVRAVGSAVESSSREVEKEQTTGTGGRVLPEEFRAGLDAYFNRFEQERP